MCVGGGGGGVGGVGGGGGGLRFWVLGLRSSFSIHPKKRVELPINGTPFGMVTARD